MYKLIGILSVLIIALFFLSCNGREDTADKTRTLYKKGVAQFNSADYPSADQTLNQVIQLNPELDNAYLTLARVYEAQKKYDSAIDILTKLVSLYPDITEAYHMLGTDYIALGKDQDAEIAFKKSVTLSAKLYYKDLRNLASIDAEHGRYDDAYKIYAHLLNLKDFSGKPSRNRRALLYYDLGIVLMYQNDPKRALASLRKSVYFNRSYIPAYFPLGMVYVFLNKKESAMQCYTTLFNADSKMAKVLYDIVKYTKKPGAFEQFFAKYKDKLSLNK